MSSTKPTLSLPSVPSGLIRTAQALEETCAHLGESGRFAFDTEFIGENSYQPLLCLVQVATAERVELIDPLAIEDLEPLWALMADERIEKICHAGDQDFAIVWQRSGLKPANVFDTQIGAGLIGLGYPLALWRVVENYSGVELDKAHTYSAWDRRPLSREQIAYAVDDVRYLPLIHQEMSRHMYDLSRLGWMRQACDDLCDQAARTIEPRMIWARIKGAGSLEPVQLAVLRELAVWREQMAYEHDMTARTMMKDEVMLELATRMPRRATDLPAIKGLATQEIDSYSDQLIGAVARGRAIPEAERPRIGWVGEDTVEIKRMAEMLMAAAQVICLGQSVSPSLVTSQAEITALARRVVNNEDLEKHVLMTGWHRECLGQRLVDFVRGKSELDLRMNEQGMNVRFLQSPPVENDTTSSSNQ